MQPRLNSLSTPEWHTALLGEASEVPVAPAHWWCLWKVPPRRTWDESLFLSTGPGGRRAAVPRSTPQRVHVRLCAWPWLFASFLLKLLFALK